MFSIPLGRRRCAAWVGAGERGTVLRNDHAIQMKVRRGFEPVSEVSHGEERRVREGEIGWVGGRRGDGRRSKTDFSIMLATKGPSLGELKREK